MLLKRGTGNGEWGMGNAKFKWEIENDVLLAALYFVRLVREKECLLRRQSEIKKQGRVTSSVIIFPCSCTERFKYETWVLIIAAEKIYSTLQKVNVIKHSISHFQFPIERSSVSVKCLAQEHSTVSLARRRTRTA